MIPILISEEELCSMEFECIILMCEIRRGRCLNFPKVLTKVSALK
jgi:hypothetical protein